MMKTERDALQRPAAHATAAPRKRKHKYTTDVYGARLPREDARLVDEYAAANRMDRSTVVRLAVREFTLRRQMKITPPDPLAKLVEAAVARQIAPLQQVLLGLQPLLKGLFAQLFDKLKQPR
jgi:hypothetical protein